MELVFEKVNQHEARPNRLRTSKIFLLNRLLRTGICDSLWYQLAFSKHDFIIFRLLTYRNFQKLMPECASVSKGNRCNAFITFKGDFVCNYSRNHINHNRSFLVLLAISSPDSPHTRRYAHYGAFLDEAFVKMLDFCGTLLAFISCNHTQRPFSSKIFFFLANLFHDKMSFIDRPLLRQALETRLRVSDGCW